MVSLSFYFLHKCTPPSNKSTGADNDTMNDNKVFLHVVYAEGKNLMNKILILILRLCFRKRGIIKLETFDWMDVRVKCMKHGSMSKREINRRSHTKVEVMITRMKSNKLSDEALHLSRYPFFTFITRESYTENAYQLRLPAKLKYVLPSKRVPAVISCRKRKWNAMFNGHEKV